MEGKADKIILIRVIADNEISVLDAINNFNKSVHDKFYEKRELAEVVNSEGQGWRYRATVMSHKI